MCNSVPILTMKVKLNRETNYTHKWRRMHEKLSTVAYVQLSVDLNDAGETQPRN